MGFIRAHLVCFANAAALVAIAAPCRAQVHGSADVQGGLARRFLSGGDLGAGIGPVVVAQADVVLSEPVRAGPYVDFEVVPTGEPAAPQIVSFGAHAKFDLPSPYRRHRWWVFAGFGYAAVIAPSYHQTLFLPDPASPGSQADNQNVSVTSAGGSFFEVPVGIGTAWRLARQLEWIVELSGRFGFLFSGSYFDSAGRPASSASTNVPIALNPAGTEVFALFLTTGPGVAF